MDALPDGPLDLSAFRAATQSMTDALDVIASPAGSATLLDDARSLLAALESRNHD